MDPRDFLRFARGLLETEDAPSLRSAISRAYYAAHHVGAELLETVGIEVPQSGDRHMHVPRWLKRATDREVRRAGAQLAVLYDYRVQADYALSGGPADWPEHPENPLCAQMRVQEAANMIRWLTAVLNDGPRLQTVRYNLQAAKRRGAS